MLACLAANTADAANCGEASGSAAIKACDQELSRDPGNIEVRLRYADVLMGQRQYQKAVNILSDALVMQPGNDTVKQKYRLASSLAEEQQSINQLSTDTPAAGTQNSVQEILCKTMKGQRAISACDQVLATDPRNITALTRRGDELMALNQVGDAVASYRRAVALEPANPTLMNKLARAESKLPEKPRVVVVEAPRKDEAAKVAEEKRKAEEASLAEEKRKANEVKRKKEAERKRKEAEQRRLAELEQKRKEEAELKLKEAEQRRLAELEQKRKEEAELKLKEAEQRRLAELEQKRKEEAERKLKEAEQHRLAELEQKRKEEAERKLKEAEQRRLAELEQKRKEEAERKLKEAEQRRLAEQEQKRKEAELIAKLETSSPEIITTYSNASFANGSTY